MSSRSRLATIFLLSLALGRVGPALAETDFLWPSFAVTAGGYRIDTSNKIRLDGDLEGFGTRLDFSKDLGLPEAKTVLAAGFDWGFAERHSLGLRYYALKREGGRSIQGEIQIGDTTFPVGASVSARFDTDTVEAVYTYWFARHEKVGFGASGGLVYLGLDSEVTGTFQVGGGGGSASRHAEANTDVPVPMIGLAVKGSPLQRLVLHAEARYLPSVTIGDISGKASSYSFGADYYIIGPVGIGASFDGSTYDIDIDKKSWDGTVRMSSNGFRVYLTAAF